MNMTFRWYGRGNDTVTLEHVKQIPGVKGIVWALHQKPVGDVWEKEEIRAETEYIQSYGFHAEVVESVNVHEAIKLGNEERGRYIENYKQTIRNLAEFGVKVICYNFMPVFDWTRTDMFRPLEDGSTALFFEKAKVESLDPQELIRTVEEASDMTLPGWEPEKLARIKELFAAYRTVDEEKLWDNLSFFLQEILPVAEAYGVQMAIHRMTRRGRFSDCRALSQEGQAIRNCGRYQIHRLIVSPFVQVQWEPIPLTTWWRSLKRMPASLHFHIFAM